MSWEDIKIPFGKKYLSERYYNGKAKEFYKIRMGSMLDGEYTTILLKLLRYLAYLMDEKENI